MLRTRVAVSLFPVVVLATVFFVTETAQAQWLDSSGWNDLFAEYGAQLETGVGVKATVVEAPTSTGNYMPNVGDAQFSGKTLINGTPGGSSGTSSHSNTSTRNFTGNTVSIGRGITDITIFEAGDYLGRLLNFNTGGEPLPDTFEIGTHSYIDNANEIPVVENILYRFDYVMGRDNSIHAVGLNNGAGSLIPRLLAPSHNAISVGRSDGGHSRGTTLVYATGQTRPHIVAEGSFTSATTPRVGGAAAMLREAARGTNAENNQVIRSLLFAGATKEEFQDWDRTTIRPVDEVFGFGELNIFNSYKIHEAGEFDGQPMPLATVPLKGWDFASFDGSTSLAWDLDLVRPVKQIVVALVWNVDVIDTNPGAAFTPAKLLADLNLQLRDGNDALIQTSDSPVDNFEHLFALDLASGQYSFELNGDLPVDVGVAWRVDYQPGVFPLAHKKLDGVVAGASEFANISFSDDKDFKLDPSPTTNPQKQIVDVILTTLSTTPTPSRFGFSVEASVIGGPEGDVTQTIQLMNQLTNVWEVVDERPASTKDEVNYFEATGNLARFIKPNTQEILARVTWTSPGFSGDPFFWSLDIDEVVWVIEDQGGRSRSGGAIRETKPVKSSPGRMSR